MPDNPSDTRGGKLRPDAKVLNQLRDLFHEQGAIISIAGPDGAGKTTLAGQLVDAFMAAELPVRSIHIYTWYKNLFFMPFQLAAMRRQNQIIILDRSIYDNIIELARKIHLPISVLRACLTFISKTHSRFDHRIVLWASLDTLISRRPEEEINKVKESRDLYSLLPLSAGYAPVETEGPVLEYVVQIISRTQTSAQKPVQKPTKSDSANGR